MIKVKAKIKLYEIFREFPIVSGYRPVFSFGNKKTSGSINLVTNQQLFPGEEAEIEVRFVNSEYLGDSCYVGSGFTFEEGIRPLGEGIILEILNE